MTPSGLGFLYARQIARAAELEQALLRLAATMPCPPSREVLLEEHRRANLATQTEVTFLEVADGIWQRWASAP